MSCKLVVFLQLEVTEDSLSVLTEEELLGMEILSHQLSINNTQIKGQKSPLLT
jgi:hypothetical protein